MIESKSARIHYKRSGKNEIQDLYLTRSSRNHVGESSGGYNVYGPYVTKWHNVHGKDAEELVASLGAEGEPARIFNIGDKVAVDNPDISKRYVSPVVAARHTH